jgi:hypothetical protein
MYYKNKYHFFKNDILDVLHEFRFLDQDQIR